MHLTKNEACRRLANGDFVFVKSNSLYKTMDLEIDNALTISKSVILLKDEKPLICVWISYRKHF